MIATLGLVVLGMALLTAVGLAALAPVARAARQRLLPAAPVFGAALIAVITNWTSRWMSIRESLPVIALVLLCLVAYGIYKQTEPFRVSKGAWCGMGVALIASLTGLTVAAVPAFLAGDANAVASTYNIDQFYFAGVSSWLTDHSLLPGPVLTDAWQGNDSPATAPAAETAQNSLRYGQSAVAAVLSLATLQTPYATVSSLSLLWLLLVGVSAYTSCSLLGLTRRWAAVTTLLTTTSFYVVSQSLEGKHDGLLGASMALLTAALSVRVVVIRKYSWALVLVAAGLVATYYEYLLLLLPALAAFALIGSRGSRLHRVNAIAGRWAAAAALVPWAWLMLAQSLKTTSRATAGPTPFQGKSGWGVLHTYAGFPTFNEWVSANALSSIAVVLVATGLLLGMYAASKDIRLGAFPLGLLASLIVLVALAADAEATYMQYRVLQLGMPLMVFTAATGWALLWNHHLRLGQFQVPMFLARALGTAAAVLFLLGNVVSVALSTSHERALNQHIPAAFMTQVARLVENEGAENVSVIAPTLTDTSALSLLLRDHDLVSFPVVPGPSSYVGRGPRWDERVDEFFVLGRGAVVSGDAVVLSEEGDYRIVRLEPGGLIAAPLTAVSWARTSWMRGFPCASEGARLLVIRDADSPGDLAVASRAKDGADAGIRLVDAAGVVLDQVGEPERSSDWLIQTFRLPDGATSILTIGRSDSMAASGTVTFPVIVGEDSVTDGALASMPSSLVDFCLNSTDDGSDGYDRDVTLMRMPW